MVTSRSSVPSAPSAAALGQVRHQLRLVFREGGRIRKIRMPVDEGRALVLDAHHGRGIGALVELDAMGIGQVGHGDVVSNKKTPP